MDTTAAITQFIIDEVLPDVDPGDLDPDRDLLADGILDSLSLVTVIRWLETRFGLSILDADELEFDAFRSVATMSAFVDQSLVP